MVMARQFGVLGVQSHWLCWSATPSGICQFLILLSMPCWFWILNVWYLGPHRCSAPFLGLHLQSVLLRWEPGLLGSAAAPAGIIAGRDGDATSNWFLKCHFRRTELWIKKIGVFNERILKMSNWWENYGWSLLAIQFESSKPCCTRGLQ